MIDVFVARQPIFDRGDAVMAYELLYRGGGTATRAEGATPNRMSADVLVNVLTSFGMERVTSGRRAFVNFTREMLLEGAYRLFDPRTVVIELLESVVCDEQTLPAVEAMVAAGYEVALDDFEYSESMEPFLRLARIIKLDVLDATPEQIAARVKSVSGRKLRLLAERVETAEVRDVCRALGFELFQGYFFERPELLSKREIPVEQVAIARLMNLLRDPDTSDKSLEDAFAGDVSLAFKLLALVNSAAVGGRGIQSIQHAVRLLGRESLYRWLAILFVSSLAGDSGTAQELVHTAVLRARLCELIGESKGKTSGPLFLVGLFSMLDALMRIPMSDILGALDLSSDVRSALLTRDGPLAAPLSLVEAYEKGRWDEVFQVSPSTGVKAAEVPELYLQSLAWARERLVGAAG